MDENKILTYSNLHMEFPTKIVKIETLEIVEEFNEHGIAKIKLTALPENEYRFIDNITAFTNIKIGIMKNEKPECIFVGVMSSIEAKKIDQVYDVEIELKSKTFLLDCEIKRRSFQNKDNPYINLFKQVIATDFKEAIAYDNASNGKLQEESIIQYDETDWQFLKRLASKLRARLIVNVKSPFPIVWVGKYKGNSYEQQVNSFHLIRKNEEFLKAQLNYGGFKEEDKINYRIKSVNNYEISDTIIYEEIVFKVCKKETTLEKGFIVFIYHLVKENGLQGNPIVNHKILGSSIDGKILDVKVDRVKIHLSIDKKQSIDEAYWYKYETAYTSEGQTGFYSMPQIGDDVKLHTSLEYIEDATVRTVNRLDGKTNCKIQDPNVKYYGNTDRKELMLAPSELQVTTTNGLILINMDNKAGIEITSSTDVLIKTQAIAEVNGKRIGIRAGNEILLATKTSAIAMNGFINMKADGGVSL